MRLIKKHHKTLIILFLELLSLSPIFMILGNVVPPFPMKVHFISFGLSFLLVFLFLIQYRSKKWLVYTAIFYFILQFFLSGFNLKEFIDFFFGPFVFMSLIDLLFNNRVEKGTLWKYQKRFFMLLWVPMLISFLQFIELLPLTFWNASYINYSEVDGVSIPRANGFLYHGSELSVIIFFIACKQLIKKSKYFFAISFFILFIAYGTYYKALTATILLLIIYYYTLVNPIKLFQWTEKIYKKDKVLYITIFTLSLIGLFFILYKTQIQGVNELFPPQLLTGRGAIWNVYLKAVSDFSIFEYLFGAGIGSEPFLFEKYSTPQLFFPLKIDSDVSLAPDSHNALFSAFLNVGIMGLLFYFFLFKMCYRQIKKLENKTRNKAIYFAVFILPLFTIGVTIPYFKNAIFWITLGFLVHYWFILNKRFKDEQPT